MATILRVHLLQQLYFLSGPSMEKALVAVPSMCLFAGIVLIIVLIQDESTILTFSHLLENTNWSNRFFKLLFPPCLKANACVLGNIR